MLLLTIRTDKPEAELGLYNGQTQQAYETWPAHRRLSGDIHRKIEQLLQTQQRVMEDLDGIVCFAGPGSFTGLRIGLSVANAAAYALDVPVIATTGDEWITQGVARLQAGEYDPLALPHYGAEAHITVPRGSVTNQNQRQR